MHAPSSEILRAFRISGEPTLLAGGEGRSFRVGEFVLKPIEDVAHHTWSSTCLEQVRPSGFRVSAPIRAEDGSFVVGGWAANCFEPAGHVVGRWSEKLRAIDAFHDALRRLNPPPMPRPRNRWADAHEIAWQTEAPPEMDPHEMDAAIATQGEPLFRAYRSLPRGRDVVHSDACGNVLFADELDPLIIDFSPTIGSRAYADAILIADAIAWEGAPLTLADELLGTEAGRQHILRAIVFRLYAVALFAPHDVGLVEREFSPFLPLAMAAGAGPDVK